MLSAEALIALIIGVVSVVITVAGAAVRISMQVGKAVERFELVGTQQAREIREIKEAVTKFGDVVSLVAVQKEEIRSLRETEAQNTKRTDETFSRVFARLDALHGRGFTDDQSESRRPVPRG